MSRRWILIALIAAAAAAASATAALMLGGNGAKPALRAVAIDPPVPAPVTLGADYTGAAVQVPRAGRPALITFLFASCPDVCPLVGDEIARALDEAGESAASRIDVVAISVDPKGDTPANVTAFMRGHQLTGRMRYLIGTRAELSPIWSAWGVLAQPTEDITESLHTAKVILVDADGQQVGAYPGALPFDTSDLAADIEALTAD